MLVAMAMEQRSMVVDPPATATATSPAPASPRPPRRRTTSAALFVAAAALLQLARATTTDAAFSSSIAVAVPSSSSSSSLAARRGRRAGGGASIVGMAASSSLSSTHRRDCEDEDDDDDSVARSSPPRRRPPSSPSTSAASSSTAGTALLASLLLLSSPLVLPPPEAANAAAATSSPSAFSSDTATSIDINLRSLSSLTRRAVVNREKLTSYLVESLKSIRPILDVLSEGDAPVVVSPPKNVRGAIDRALTEGDATFVVNGNQVVDVRLESVPGAIIVRVINPNIPRLPFLGDGTAAARFAEGVVDVAPAGLERAAEGAMAIGDFLTWGAPRGGEMPVRYAGSALDVFLSSKFAYGGDVVANADLTNGEVAFLSLVAGVGGAYAASYAYYVALREEADKEANEKKAAVAAAKAAAAKKKTGTANEAKEVEGAVVSMAKTTTTTTTTTTTIVEAPETTVGPADEETGVVGQPKTDEGEGVNEAPQVVVEAERGGVGESVDGAGAPKEGDAPRRRKRDAIMKNLFGRGK